VPESRLNLLIQVWLCVVSNGCISLNDNELKEIKPCIGLVLIAIGTAQPDMDYAGIV